MEVVQIVGMAAVYSPGFTSIQQDWHHYSFVDLSLVWSLIPFLFKTLYSLPNAALVFSPSSDYYLIIYIGILGYDAAKVGEFVNVDMGLTIDSDVRHNKQVAWSWLV